MFVRARVLAWCFYWVNGVELNQGTLDAKGRGSETDEEGEEERRYHGDKLRRRDRSRLG